MNENDAARLDDITNSTPQFSYVMTDPRVILDETAGPVKTEPQDRIVAAIEAGFEKLSNTVDNVLSSKFRSVSGQEAVAALEKRLERKFETISADMEQACLARQGLIQVDFDQQFQITALRRDLDAILPLFDSVSAKPGEELTFGQLVDIETGELSPKLAELTASGRNFKVVVEPMPARLELRLPAVGRRPPV